MADEADRAQQVIDEDLENKIAAARGHVPVPGSGATVCQCGSDIPQPRADAGYTTCIDCQRDKEHWDRMCGARSVC